MDEHEAFRKQTEYYRDNAESYDQSGFEGIVFALFLLEGFLKRSGCKTVLDVGSGTGRALLEMSNSFPDLDVIGIEPNDRMRAVGHKKGIPQDRLIYGDAAKLQFANDSFDLVTEFGVLHHVPNPNIVVQEMVRVAKRGVFLCDSNNWGQGSLPVRVAKQLLRNLGVWDLATRLTTRGRWYKYSEGDGIYYSFSLYDTLSVIQKKFPKVYVMNSDAPRIVYSGIFQAPGICVLAIN